MLNYDGSYLTMYIFFDRFRDLVPFGSENVETTDDSDAKDPLNLSKYIYLCVVVQWTLIFL